MDHLQLIEAISATLSSAPNRILVVRKGLETYVFAFDQDSVPALWRTFGRFAGDPELSFSWYDAAVLSQRLRGERREIFGA